MDEEMNKFTTTPELSGPDDDSPLAAGSDTVPLPEESTEATDSAVAENTANTKGTDTDTADPAVTENAKPTDTAAVVTENTKPTNTAITVTDPEDLRDSATADPDAADHTDSLTDLSEDEFFSEETEESESEKETLPRKKKRPNLLRRFYEKYGLPDPVAYLWKHKFQLLLTLLVAAAIMVPFVYQKFIAAYHKFNPEYVVPTMFLDAAQVAKEDGDALSEVLLTYICGSIYLSIPVFLALYWIGRLSIFTPRKRTGNRILLWLLRLLRLALAGFAWYTILTWQGIHLQDVPLHYLSNLSYYGLWWIGAWAAPALILTDFSMTRTWLDKVHKIHGWFITLLSITVTILACYCIVELSCESKLHVLIYMRIFSVIYWLLFYLVLYILIRRKRLTSFLCLFCAEFIGLGNYCVMQFRGTYVMSGDLTVLGTAAEVASGYTLIVDRYFYIPLAIFLICTLLMFLLLPGKSREEKREEKRRKKERKQERRKAKQKHTPLRRRRLLVRWGSTILGEVLVVGFILIGFYDGFLYGYINGNTWNYTNDVEDNGYLPFFFSNLMATNVVTLDGYSRDDAAAAIEAGAAAYDANHPDQGAVTEEEPNIIVIQSEAFSDPSVVYDYETNEDPMPFIHSLTENTQKGYVNASVYGGPTANTEFEFLTRYSLAYLAPGSIPYAQYVKTTMPSILTVLQNQETSYNTYGFHPYHASGYNRESVYQTLGFDDILFYEDTTGRKRIRNLLSDEADFDDVIGMIQDNEEESDNPLFVFNVTIQNHSPFTTLNDQLPNKIEVTSFQGTNGINNYLTLIRESDRAFQELVEYFENVDEPTIILMYGDHQPSWDDDSQEVWNQHLLDADDPSKQDLNKYYIPYIMWANFDIDEYDGLKYGDNPGEFNQISMNYLSSKLLEAAGLQLSDYDKYLLNLHETIPAISRKGYWTSDGEWHDNNNTGEYTDILFDYHQICYNLLFDRKHHLWDLFGGEPKSAS